MSQTFMSALTIRNTGERWRQDASEAPVVELNRPNPVIAERCGHFAQGISAHAVMTRDLGYCSGGYRGFVGLLAAERAFHLALDFRDSLQGPFLPFDNELAGMLCEGAFGDWLPYVLCAPQNPDRGRGLDAWHFLAFVTEDWHSPICGLRPEGYLTWSQRQDLLARQARSA